MESSLRETLAYTSTFISSFLAGSLYCQQLSVDGAEESEESDQIYNPIWDQARCHLPDRTYEDEGLVFASNFECGNGRRFRKLAEGRYTFDLEPEPGNHVYSGRGYYFCFALLNKLDQRT
jgi:hypothetical protein